MKSITARIVIMAGSILCSISSSLLADPPSESKWKPIRELTDEFDGDKLDAKKILVAVPSLSLIKQTLEVWARESVANKQDIHWMAVCSDESVGDIAKDDIALAELTQPEDLAPMVAFLASGLANHATGGTFDINAGSYVH